MFLICTRKNLCKRTHLWPWAVEISTPYLAMLSPILGRSWSTGGSLPLATITAPFLLSALRRVEKRGAIELSRTLRQTAGQVFMYGVQTGRCDRNPSIDLHSALKPVTVKHMSAILEPIKVGELLRAIDSYSGQSMTRAALGLSALLFQRPVNIRQMKWAWVDFDNALLTIPSQDIKRSKHPKINGRPH
jgi:integrase